MTSISRYKSLSLTILLLGLLLTVLPCNTAQAAPPIPQVINGGFETVDVKSNFASGWTRGFGAETHASADLDTNVFHSGARSLRISDSTPTTAYRYAIVNSDWINVEPSTTYRMEFWARGHGVGLFKAGAGFEGAGEYRQPLPVGDYDWREISVRLTTPADCRRITLQFVADGVTDAIWIDDVRLERSPVQLANLKEVQSPKPYSTWFPRTPGPLPNKLVVADVSHQSTDVCTVLTALQGLVNRKGAKLYLINPTNPAGYDNRWLNWLKEKKYTGAEERLADPMDAITRFRSYFHGVIVWDPSLPGSVNAAWMLASVRDCLPCSPEMAKRLHLPVIEDLWGRWHRNVDAYRYVYERYWPVMSHNLLAWEYPLTTSLSSRDYMVQHRVLMFWASAPGDKEAGADPTAEMEFIEEVLSQTPGNVPVMGWPMYGNRGIEEYTAVRLLSEFGKWVPGTGFSSNVSVHSAVTPASSVFRQPKVTAAGQPDPKTAYLTVNIMDSGDAQWYWQLYQQGIWADPVRGAVPTGYGMNVTILDTLPAVAQWYYEHRAPGDTLFGLLYMNAPVYASRFRPVDRERIWADFVRQFDSYRKRLDMDGIEIYNGGNSGASAPDALFRRYTSGMKGLHYILADLGRHDGVPPDHVNEIIDGVAIFHTRTNFRIWSTTAELSQRTMEGENSWLRDEIVSHTPQTRPSFVSALAISWYYYPAWIKDLATRLPANYKIVSPGQLAQLYLAAKAQLSPFAFREGANTPPQISRSNKSLQYKKSTGSP